MRRACLAAALGCVGCTALNPAFGLDPGDSAVGTTEGTIGTGVASTTGATTEQPGTSAPTTGVGSSTGAVDTTADASSGPVDTGPPDTTAPGSTTDPVGTTGDASTGVDPGVCGDGVIDMGEVCDAGPEPPLVPGGCLPNCKGKIPSKRILAGGGYPADFAKDFGLMTADQLCNEIAQQLGGEGTYKAVISDGATRFAAKAPYDPTLAKDWPIKPYTAYVNLDGNTVWVTGKVPLLGVVPSADPNQPNMPLPLLHPVTADEVPVWTGMLSDWTTASTCNKWISTESLGYVGLANQTKGFLDALGSAACVESFGFLCAEQ